MGSKSKGKPYISKGIVGRPMRTPAKGAEKIFNKLNAWKAGKPVKLFRNNEWVDAREVWGSPFRKTRIEIVDED